MRPRPSHATTLGPWKTARRVCRQDQSLQGSVTQGSEGDRNGGKEMGEGDANILWGLVVG